MKTEESRKRQIRRQTKSHTNRLEEMTKEELRRIRDQQRWAVLLECMSVLLFGGIGGYLVIRKQYCVLDYPLYIFYGVLCVVIMGLLFMREWKVYTLLKEEISLK